MREHRLVDVLRQSGVPDLVEILADRLSATDLDAVLFETHRRRAKRTSPIDLLTRYQGDPHVAPSPSTVGSGVSLDALALTFAAPAFETLELSPICPVGAIAALTSVDPAAAWGAAGRSEVVSDCRTVLALEAALRRSAEAYEGDDNSRVRLATSHRELHVPFSAPLKTSSHRRVFALCTAGTSRPERFEFGATALVEQLGIQLRVLEHAHEAGLQIGLVSVTLFHETSRNLGGVLRSDVVEPLHAAFPEVRVVTTAERRVGRGFYAPVGFAVTIEDHAEVEHQVALGGLTDWGAQLLDRPTEGMLVSMMATEEIARICTMDPTGHR